MSETIDETLSETVDETLSGAGKHLEQPTHAPFKEATR